MKSCPGSDDIFTCALRKQAQHLLGGSIGTATAEHLVDTAIRSSDTGADNIYQLLDTAGQALQFSPAAGSLDILASARSFAENFGASRISGDNIMSDSPDENTRLRFEQHTLNEIQGLMVGLINGKVHYNFGVFAHKTFYLEITIMASDNSVADGQSQSRTFAGGFCREKWFGNLSMISFCIPIPVSINMVLII